ncbi:HNH endonuclease [Agrococcus sp. SGAir0287]|uniref:HNH endonuclease n=1 Tax=Agrococcus sp. SGAir0287 TaxID=2070347 RepID=UPI0015863677|nr:HNH endonuclease [Agrococcus sp. SGAir0287]
MKPVTELDASAVDRYADALTEVARALAERDVTAARAALAPIAGEVWEGSLKRAGTRNSDGEATGERDVDDAARARTFLGDGMRCTYCGGRAIPRSILVAMSDVFPDELPYYWRYKTGTVHPAYWAVAAEADHVLAHSAGGAGDDGNLATLHVACNTIKSDSSRESMPVIEARPAPEGWDGLVSLYAACVLAGNSRGARHHAIGYHTERMKHFGVSAIEPEAAPDQR